MSVGWEVFVGQGKVRAMKEVCKTGKSPLSQLCIRLSWGSRGEPCAVHFLNRRWSVVRRSTMASEGTPKTSAAPTHT